MTSRARLMLALIVVGLVAVPIGSAAAAPVQGVAAPQVVPRAEWGAQPPTCTWGSAPGWTNAVIHHTDGPTTTNAADSAEAVRTVQGEHMSGNGWCDIGYHFLVDQEGTIFEGTEGSIDGVPVGAHVGGFNTGSLGVALIGDFTEQAPSAAMLEAVGQIAGWELGLYGVDPDSTILRTAGEGVVGRPIGTELTVPVIAGHRDLGVTECPGDAAYEQLLMIRATAVGVVQAMRSSGQFGSRAPAASATLPDVGGLTRSLDVPGGLVAVAAVTVVLGITVVALRVRRARRLAARRRLMAERGAPRTATSRPDEPEHWPVARR